MSPIVIQPALTDSTHCCPQDIMHEEEEEEEEEKKKGFRLTAGGRAATERTIRTDLPN
jgi:hypothetical protein